MNRETTNRATLQRVLVAIGMIAGLAAAASTFAFEQAFESPRYMAFGLRSVSHEAAFNFARLAPIAILLGVAAPIFLGRYRQASVAAGIAIVAVAALALAQVFVVRFLFPIDSQERIAFLAPEIAVWTVDGSLLLAAPMVAAISLGRAAASVAVGCLCGAACGAIQWTIFVAFREQMPYPDAYWFLAAIVLGSFGGLALAAIEFSPERRRSGSPAIPGLSDRTAV